MPVTWRLQLDCQDYMSVFNATTRDQLLSYSLRPGSGCRVSHRWPEDFPLVLCTSKWYSDEAIDRCNVTGRWRNYEADVETACLTMEGRAYSVRHRPYDFSDEKPGLYKNIFCAICNMEKYPQYGYCGYIRDIEGGVTPKTPMFKMLLGFGSSRRKSVAVFRSTFNFTSCPEGEWAAPDGSCLAVHCRPGKLLENEACVTALTEIRGLGYRLNLWFEPLVNQTDTFPEFIDSPPITEAIIGIDREITRHLSKLGDGFNVSYGVAVPIAENDDYHPRSILPQYRVRLPVAFWVKGYVIASGRLTRDTFETLLFEKLITDTFKLSYQVFRVYFNARVLFEETPQASLCSQPGMECGNGSRSYIGIGQRIFNMQELFLNTNELLSCPFITFAESEYTATTREGETFFKETRVLLKMGETELAFSEPGDFNSLAIEDDGVLSVCRHVLDAKLEELEAQQRREFYSKHFRSELDDSTTAQYYLTLVCAGVSMACLVLTLLTYFRFRVLRNDAGLNNVFLCASLLLAQASLLASSHVSGPKKVCTVLGVLTHFLWLWVFAWSFICCFHMFRVFTAKIRQASPDHSQTNGFAWRVALSVLVPSAVVCVVIVPSKVTSGGSRTGYGRDSCYLDSSLLIGLATVLPLALVCVSNTVFFAITVAKIDKARKIRTHLSSRKEDRNNLYIYVKLSTLTGVFWLVQILAEALNVEVLRFIAIIANGLQGAFIFLSYVCNKRVLNLYLRSLGLEPMTLTSTSSGSQRGTGVSTVEAQAPRARKTARTV